MVVCCGQACEVPAFVDMRGLLGFWLLWELRLGPLLGAQLAERLAWRRGHEVSPGTLYPALAALAKAKLVRKEREGRDTRYALTGAGQRELACARLYLQAVLADVMQP
jgi:DNA-binding PadR family transcriptional regulator